ncbi:hypothetical protein PENSPDRAFT_692801 [Peniophora sp. CONT]|nr:hypothetical protein PENSPDRAFT_692801 [Peniophora sp. CONT]
MGTDGGSSPSYEPSQDLLDPTGTQEELPHRPEAFNSMDAATALYSAGGMLHSQTTDSQLFGYSTRKRDREPEVCDQCEDSQLTIVAQEKEISLRDEEIARQEAELAWRDEELARLYESVASLTAQLRQYQETTGCSEQKSDVQIARDVQNLPEPQSARATSVPLDSHSARSHTPVSSECWDEYEGYSQAEGAEREERARERQHLKNLQLVKSDQTHQEHPDTHQDTPDIEYYRSQYRQDPAERALAGHVAISFPKSSRTTVSPNNHGADESKRELPF